MADLSRILTLGTLFDQGDRTRERGALPGAYVSSFDRMESAVCSEMVMFDRLNLSARLPEGETVAVEFTPEEPGEIPFQCQMGMLRGKVVVH